MTAREIETVDAHSETRSWVSRSVLITVGIGVALFILAALIILDDIGGHPAFAYNWESYTLWKGVPWWKSPSWNAFDLTDGLMTDSGRSWWVIAPAWVAFKIGDLNLTNLRVATGLVAALAVPFTWLLGRDIAGAMPVTNGAEQRRFGPRVGLLAAMLLPLLPSWLLYARTATLVGLSVAPAVLTVLLVLRVRRLTSRWWIWLIALQGMLFLNIWAYAPIRFLYFFAIIYFVVEIHFDPRKWKPLAIAAMVTAVTLPAFLGLIDNRPGWQPVTAISGYYNARGEQLASLSDYPYRFRYYIREPQPADATPSDLQHALMKQNTVDLVKLLFDVDTKPALVDYWNNHGRLLPWLLVPFMLLGMGISLRWALKVPEMRLLHLCFWGFSLPMIATSKVHIGRLVFAIPFICIFIAIGVTWFGTESNALIRNSHRSVHTMILKWALPVLLVTATAWIGWRDYDVSLDTPLGQRVAQYLEANQGHFAAAGGAVWVFGDRKQAENEAVNLATAEIEVYSQYQFVNLATGQQPDPRDPRPVLYYGGIIDQLNDPTLAPTLCALPWIVPEGGPDLHGKPLPCISNDVTVIS